MKSNNSEQMKDQDYVNDTQLQDAERQSIGEAMGDNNNDDDDDYYVNDDLFPEEYRTRKNSVFREKNAINVKISTIKKQKK